MVENDVFHDYGSARKMATETAFQDFASKPFSFE